MKILALAKLLSEDILTPEEFAILKHKCIKDAQNCDTDTEVSEEDSEDEDQIDHPDVIHHKDTFHHGNDAYAQHHISKGEELQTGWKDADSSYEDVTEYLLLHPDLKGVTINTRLKKFYFHTSINTARIYNSVNKMTEGQRKHEHHVLIVKN